MAVLTHVVTAVLNMYTAGLVVHTLTSILSYYTCGSFDKAVVSYHDAKFATIQFAYSNHEV